MTNTQDCPVLKPDEKIIISDTPKEKVIESEMKTKVISGSAPDLSGKVTDSTSTYLCPSEAISESSTPEHSTIEDAGSIDDPINVLAEVNTGKRNVAATKNDSSKSAIEGHIVNTAKVPIPSAWVGLYSTANEIAEVLTATTYTDRYGYYIFNDIALGDYTIKTKAIFF